MPTGPLISVEEYLRTSYRPDCDYLDGEVVERDLGESKHSDTRREFFLSSQNVTPNCAEGCGRNSAYR